MFFTATSQPQPLAVTRAGLQTGRGHWIFLSAFVLCILDGAIRKWLLRDTESVLKYAPYFAKDVALLAFVVFAKDIQEGVSVRLLRRWVWLALGLFASGAMVSSFFGSEEVSPIGILLSVRSFFLLPLATVAAISRLRRFRLDVLAVVLGGLTIVNAALGTIQYSASSDAGINVYAAKEFEAVTFGENVRAMGTFSYITGFGTMAIVGAWAGTVLLSYGTRRRVLFLLGTGISLAALWCALLSISRGPTIIVLIVLLMWLVASMRNFGGVLQACAAFALVTVMLVASGKMASLQNAYDTLLARNEEAADMEERLTPPIDEVLAVISVIPLGIGFGSEQVGGVFAQTGMMSFRNFESQFSRIIAEVGVIGLLGFCALFIGVSRALLGAWWRTKDPALRASIATGTVVLAWLMYSNVAFDHIASFFMWAIAAALLGAAGSDEQIPVKERCVPDGDRRRLE